MKKKMKIHLWKEVIEYFEKVGPEFRLWNYVTALRGYDCDKKKSVMWKYLFTCLIRGGCESALDIYYTRTILDHYKLNPYLIASLDKDVSHHWLSHSSNGFGCLGVYYRDALNNESLGTLFFELEDILLTNQLDISSSQLDMINKVREIIDVLFEE